MTNKMTSQQISISNWKPDFPRNAQGRTVFSSLMIAPCKSGKTYLIEHLLKTKLKGKFDAVIVFSTKVNLIAYSKFVPPTEDGYQFLIPGWDPKVVDYFREKNATTDERKKINCLIILDDLQGNSMKYDQDVMDLFCNGRHSLLSVIFLAQNGSVTANVWKTNCQLIFMFWQPSARDRKYLVEKILEGSVRDLEFDDPKTEFLAYMEILRKYTKPKHNCLVLRPLEEKKQLYWYHA